MNRQRLQPIDQISIIVIFLLSIVIGVLIWGGKACGTNCWFRNGPHVQHFSWQNQQLGIENQSFLLTFDRPMDSASVEKNLVINPPLPGKISWSGRRLAYTLEMPIPYGEKYELQLQDAREKFRGEKHTGEAIKPFVGEFYSRDRALGYIGTQGEEQGRLILYNSTQKKKSILTPPNLSVMNFKFYPKGEKILFSASERNRGIEGLRELQLYTVTTGINQSLNDQFQKVELVLDNQEYQNNQFDLSADGQTIVVQRVNRKNPADFDLWMLKEGEKPKPLNVQGGEFLITPDSKALAVARGQGIGILPLQPEAKPLDFLPKFGQLLSFSPDGSAAAMVDFNMNDPKLRYTKSLFYVNNKGVQKKLLNIKGSIVACQFNPGATYLYCLLTQLLEGAEYREQPFFAKVNIKTSQVTPLAALPQYQDIKISMSPDGLALIFDQVITTNNPLAINNLMTNSGEAVIGGNLWLLIPPNINSPQSQPEVKELPLVGFRPQWLP